MGRLAVILACLIGIALAVSGQGTEAGAAAAPTPPAVAPATPAPAPSQAPAAGLDAGAMFHMARQMDANGDLLVEEKELAEGFTKFTQDAAAVRTDVLAWLDKDQDGKLSMDEWRPFFKAMWMLNSIRSVDKNSDLVLEDGEVDAARAQMTEFCRSANERTLRQFDLDRDGKLNEAESQAARRAMRRFTPRAPANGGTRSGGESGALAPDAGAVPAGTAPATPPAAPQP